MENRMVEFRNMVNGRVVVNKPTYGIRREWVKRNQKVKLPYDIVEQLLFDTGFKNMIDSGILYIDDMQTKIDLGLESVDATEPENIIVLDEKQMIDLMTTIPLTVFKKKVSELSRVQVDNLISFAIEKDLTNADKCKYLKELTGGKDVLSAISKKQTR